MDLRFVTAGVLAGLAAGGVQAQKTELAPSAALACMTPAESERSALSYPFNAYKEGRGGRVRAALVFEAPAAAPRVEVLEQEGGDDFVDAVRQHLSAYRVPCMTVGNPVRLVFAFGFHPTTREVRWQDPIDAADAERREQLRCLVGTGAARPEYPAVQRVDTEGRVIARMRFVAPDRPPEVETFSRPSAQELARSARRWLAGLRMPCLKGGPVEAERLFIFQATDARYGFPPMDLLSLLRATDGIERQTVSLDTRAMGCPFELKLQYRQPLLPNVVGEVGPHDPAREPLKRWLRGVKLKLDPKTEDAVFGDTADIAVPCINIQLTPKEKTS